MSKGSGKSGSVQTAAGGRTPAKTADGITYSKGDRAVRNGDVAILVSVAKLDAAWRKDGTYHIPPGGGSDKGKYANAKAYVQNPTKGAVKMSEVHFDRKSGAVSISDGRHRAAAIRDLGKRTMWVTVSRSQTASAKKALA